MLLLLLVQRCKIRGQLRADFGGRRFHFGEWTGNAVGNTGRYEKLGGAPAIMSRLPGATGWQQAKKKPRIFGVFFLTVNYWTLAVEHFSSGKIVFDFGYLDQEVVFH